MRVAWGRVEPGKWDKYEAACRKGAAEAGKPDGLLAHRLLATRLARPGARGLT